jgi:epoxyqueuosine reductase
VLIAIGNSGEPSLASAAEARLHDDSPVVRAMAVWALSKLLPPHEFATRATLHGPTEPDPDVLREWNYLALPIAGRESQ